MAVVTNFAELNPTAVLLSPVVIEGTVPVVKNKFSFAVVGATGILLTYNESVPPAVLNGKPEAFADQDNIPEPLFVSDVKFAPWAGGRVRV
jgi:hypothetical protein